MSLRLISLFQMRLYKLLISDQALSKQVKEIYLDIVQGKQYPLITINLEQARPYMPYLYDHYDVSFHISIYTKGKKQQFSLELAQQVNNILKISEINIQELVVNSIVMNNLHFEQAKDLVIKRLIMQYQASIRQNFRTIR